MFHSGCMLNAMYVLLLGFRTKVSAYTANMATFLISEGKGITLINSIDEARIRGLPICMPEGYGSILLIKGMYRAKMRNAYQCLQVYTRHHR